MGSGRTWVLLAALIVVGGAPHRAAAKRPAPDPAALCAARKLAATGGTALADLRCHGKAAAKGRAVEAPCVAGPRQRLAGAFGRAERPGSCAATGDAGAVADGLEQRARDLADLLRPFDARSKCAAKQLKALGVAAKKLYRARAKFAVDGEQTKLDGARAAARGRVERSFAKAARKGGCVTLEAPTTPGGLTERAAGTAGPLQVRIEAVKRIRIAPAARAEILAKRAAAEAAGFTVADDGSVLTGTPVPASGWLVTLGSGRGRSDIAGIATLDVPIDAPTEGQVFHGSSDTFVVGPVFRNELRPVGEALQTITFEITNDGPCGMNENPADDSAQCHAAPAAANRVRAPRPAEPVADESQLNPDAMQFPAKITTELGTYPNPAVEAEQVVCLDYDGLIESHTDRGESSETGIIAYPGSTCNIQVELGCCDNEAADIRRRVANAALPASFPIMHCADNHKGRFCQSVTKGDVALEVKGDIIKAGQTKEYEVSEGESVPILVHNNGCYGDTRVNEGFLASVLPLGGRIVDGSLGRLVGGVIHHQADSGDYFPDRDVAYQAPSPCPDDLLARFRRDRYEFETDGARARVAFRCPPTTTTTLVCPVPGLPGRFSQQGCDEPIVDYIGTSHFVHDEVTQFTSDHEEASAEFVLTNDPALAGTRDSHTFVVKSGTVTYSATHTSGGCTTTVAPTTHPLEPYPGTIPGAMIVGDINNGVRFVAATLIQLVPVTEHEVCPPPTGTTDRQDDAAVGFLLIPVPPAYSVSADAEIITGSFTDEPNHDTWEWQLHRVERGN